MNRYLGRICSALVVVGALSLFAGCKDERFSLNFNHQKHIVEREIECSVCHQQIAEGAMSRPNHTACANCHEIKEENPTAECLLCHKVKNPSAISAKRPVAPGRKERILFSHEKHSYKEAKCVDCHTQANTSAGAKDNILPAKEACLACHDDKTAPLKNCATCHVESSQINSTHKLDWESRHGIESKFGDARCLVCHREDTCIACHQDEKPSDHNNTWRKVTHGSEAAWNRSRCMVCHQEDFCDRCHRDTKPRSHTAGWVSGPTRHCLQCHFPVSAVECSVCHKQADHSSAMSSPHPPFEGFDCSFCHPTGPGIPPHPFPPMGTSCTVCHKR